jgi:hypothetical protein
MANNEDKKDTEDKENTHGKSKPIIEPILSEEELFKKRLEEIRKRDPFIYQ